MSAIWGIISCDDTTLIHEKVAQDIQEEFQKKYSADTYQHLVSDHCLFGCGIQEVSAHSKNETLPIWDEKNQILFTADCIVDNHEDLLSQLLAFHHTNETEFLKNLQTKEISDGRLLFEAYKAWGADFVTKVLGIFSIAIWNEKEKKLTLYSDPVSARCLYYTVQNGVLVFSTVLSPILKLFPEITDNENYDKDFLLCAKENIYVVAGETPYTDVFLVKPSRKYTFAYPFSKIKEDKYCTDLSKYEFQEWDDFEKVISHFMKRYQECISDAIQTQKEVGISVSSGLDSSSIAAISSKLLNKKNKNLYAYTFAAPNGGPDETSYVKDIGSSYSNMIIENLTPSNQEFVEELKESLSIMEMPLKTLPIGWLHHLIQTASKKDCKIILTGSFGNTSTSFGYPHHIFYDFYKTGRKKEFHQGLKHYCKHQNQPYLKSLKRATKSFSEYLRKEGLKQDFVPDNVFVHPSILKQYDLEERFSKDTNASFRDKLIDHTNYQKFLEAETLLVYLGVLNTKLGLSTNTILRDPTSDLRMISFCHDLPYHYFAYNGISRWLIRYGCKDLLPESILSDYEQHLRIYGSWYHKMQQDWELFLLYFQKKLADYPHKDWIFTNHLQEYLHTVSIEQNKNVQWLVHIYTIFSLFLFRE